ncbi:hypothetical protein [Aliarcobacter cibarius]|jgi:uncharacterized membrane protein YheB (UPF0754 family)|uniref:DUF445 domain-containing membrane protein n=1 Tax=Aliarcobacter cibarius TaxID=255507 RepID=A0A5J6RIE9_9BACT|nr:hypothetical protein [Aliarcobacter cibarius]QEZ89714.1 DUF445 domain-containing membrane protein [Aliarcobacter cibarius]QKJ27724.1 DUF445 domain-containing membrane protein [Aliarcobacter cibarius]TLS95312.1 DUF445 domain-containing protein [Aliarcobacter cibarius]TLS97722.1 DUF445 domain-containing protein [Aliarcobacter cibarius]TLT05012.1 DUF445 domain-containing protein [Aliarcobacter cibarius]
MNKSDITNIITVLIMAYGYSNDNNIVFMVGLFALSGAVTNTIAIYMLFEKVPFLYGSGVIESKFKEFKLSIKNLLMEQFFTKERLNSFFQDELSSAKTNIDFEKILKNTDFTLAFTSLKESIMQSPFGGMITMFGGESAIDGLKDSFVNKLQTSIITISKTETFQQTINDALKNEEFTNDVYDKLSLIVDSRLEELTPKMVKEIVQNMIKEHMFWLVVWGAIFGGLIGLVGALVS